MQADTDFCGPNQGVMILYELLNEQPGVLAERTLLGLTSCWARVSRVPTFGQLN